MGDKRGLQDSDEFLFDTYCDPPPEPESHWAETCPDWVFFVVNNAQAKLLATCGRYFDHGEDDAFVTFDGGPADEADGLWIAEGGFVSNRDWESGIEEGGWEPATIRRLTEAEWGLYVDSGENPWPAEFYAPEVEDPTCLPPFEPYQKVEEHPWWTEYGCDYVGISK